MKKYSFKQAKKGRTAYRTPSGFIYRKTVESLKKKKRKKI